jgi:hypothetical protein
MVHFGVSFLSLLISPSSRWRGSAIMSITGGHPYLPSSSCDSYHPISSTMVHMSTVSPVLSFTLSSSKSSVTSATLATQQASSTIAGTIAMAESEAISSTSGVSLELVILQCYSNSIIHSYRCLQLVNRGAYDLTILILLIVLLLVGVLLVIYFLLRRVRKQQQRRMRDLEEGVVEVKEARAMRLLDDTLKGIPEWPRSSQFYHQDPIFGEFDVPSGVVPHPLFHPGIKRSRSIESPQPVRLQLPRHALSYPRFDRYPSSSGIATFSSYLNKPVSRSTTMQTRRPETPPPPSPVQEIIIMDSIPSRLRQVRSVWSFSAASEAPPSSPSVYSDHSGTCNTLQALTPLHPKGPLTRTILPPLTSVAFTTTQHLRAGRIATKTALPPSTAKNTNALTTSSSPSSTKHHTPINSKTNHTPCPVRSTG